MKKLFMLFFMTLCACAPYQTPERGQWPAILNGATYSDMTPELRAAKKTIFIGRGGKSISAQNASATMAALEYELYDTLRKPGIQVIRAGTEVTVILTRGAFMSADSPDISADGADTLGKIAKILARDNNTFIEITGYTDAMESTDAARVLSLDMATRAALYLTGHDISAMRLFVNARGAARPIADQSAQGRQMNRRVEIRIVPVI